MKFEVGKTYFNTANKMNYTVKKIDKNEIHFLIYNKNRKFPSIWLLPIATIIFEEIIDLKKNYRRRTKS